MHLNAKIILLCGTVFACLFIWRYPLWQVANLPRTSPNLTLDGDAVRTLEIENQLRETASKIALGVFGALALYFGWKRVWAADETNRVSLQTQITERFTKAVEQLGATHDGVANIEVRLGGIYALERIARDSRRDEETIREILTAYIRHNSVSFDKKVPPVESNRVRTEIQAIITVLGRQELSSPLRSLNLRQAWLPGCNLEGCDFQGADLSQAYLGGAELSGATLQEAVFVGTVLDKANLNHARLSKAVFRYASLSGASMNLAQLYGADLSQCLGLAQWQVDSALGDHKTCLPQGLEHPITWKKNS